jgi:glycosyltransferase involved in cell wall biosynthesis
MWTGTGGSLLWSTTSSREGEQSVRVLLFNLATDADDPILGFTTHWIRALSKQVEFIHVVTMRAGRVELPANVRVYSVGKEKGYSEPRRALEFYRHLFHILREDRVDACFSHMIPIFTVLAAPLLKARRIPIVTWYAHPSLTRTLKAAHHLSDRMVASVATAYPYRHDKLAVVGQGIDTDFFCPDGSRPEDPPVILCVGRLSPVKDHPTLLRAVHLVAQRWSKPFRAVIVGGPARPEDATYVVRLRELAQALAVDSRVEFHPPIPLAELPWWYRRSTVLVNLTPTGFGDKVAWEAMACGRPCIAANEGYRDTFGRYAENLLFAYGKADSLADRLLWILALGARERELIGAYLREQVVEHHSLQGLAEKLARLLSELSTGSQ